MNTKRHTQYWVIPPEADAEFTAHMEDVLDACIKQRGCQVHTLLTAYKRLLKQNVDAAGKRLPTKNSTSHSLAQAGSCARNSSAVARTMRPKRTNMIAR